MTTNRRRITYKVQTQAISIYRNDGTRINYARKRPWRNWTKRRARLDNIRDAINYAIKARDTYTASKWGVIVILRTVTNGHSTKSYIKIFDAKWGTDGIPYTEYYGIAGNYWRRQLQKNLA